MATYNSMIYAIVKVVFADGTTNPMIATDPTSKLSVSLNVESVTRKDGEPVGVYIVKLNEPISAMTMRHQCYVCSDSMPQWCSVHPAVVDDLVSVFEIRGFTYKGDLADVMFTLEINSQWMS